MAKRKSAKNGILEVPTPIERTAVTPVEPTVTLAEMKAEYNAFYQAKPNKWASDLRNGYAFKAISEYLQGHPPKSILDVGCGNGHTLEYFEKQWPGVNYAGLDLSDEAISLAKARVPSAKFYLGALGAVKTVRQYDGVILLGVLEHIEDTDMALEQVKQLMSYGGWLFIEVPNCIAYPESEHVEGYRRIRVGNHQYEHHRTRKTWESIFAQNRFDILRSIVGPTQQTEFIWILREHVDYHDM